jgi:microcystin-dependent protein
MLQMETFIRDDVFPSWFANALTKVLSVLSSQFQLVQTDATHVQVAAGANDSAAILSIKGLWRWIEAPITIAHPGGAAGTYPIFATAKNNNITASPAPFSDDTDYTFGLSILAPGALPTIVAGVVDVYRQVGNAVWDGTKITRLDQLAPVTPLHAGRHAAGGPDALTPAMIGAIPVADSTSAQPGDLIVSAAPTRVGCVLADGTAYLRADPRYAALFAAIGTRHGAGDGSTTFNVPDYRDTTIIGASVTRPLGTRGGENTHVLSVAELPVHGHGVTDPTHAHGINDPGHGHGVSDPGHSHGMNGPPTNPGNAGWSATPFMPQSGAGQAMTNTNNNYGGGAEYGTAGSGTGIGIFGAGTGISIRGAATGVTVQNAGSGTAHNNMQQFAAANVFVKL